MMLAQALAVAGDYQGASTYFGLLIARGSRPEIRDAARQAAARVADARIAASRLATAPDDIPASDAATPPASATTSVSPPAGPPGSPRETMAQGAYVPFLRIVKTGETRVLGTFSAVECRQGAVVLLVDTAGGPVRMAAPAFSDIELLTYRQDSPSGVACGAQRPAYRVFATFRTETPPMVAAGTPNRVVAIELLPDGFSAK